MTQAQLDLIPISQLQDRYRIKRPSVYSRLASVGIEPTKLGRNSFITVKDLDRLDALDNHLSAGGTVTEFVGDVTDIVPTQNLELSPTSSPSSDSQLVAILGALFQSISSQSSDPLAHLDALERAAKHRWLLGTTELANLLKITTRAVSRHQNFDRYGFKFSRAGLNGSETAWLVEKVGKKGKG